MKKINDTDYVMRASFQLLTEDFNASLDEFIVYEEGDELIEIEKGNGQRSIYINKLIEYFANIDEFENCQILLELKNKVIEQGD